MPFVVGENVTLNNEPNERLDALGGLKLSNKLKHPTVIPAVRNSVGDEIVRRSDSITPVRREFPTQNIPRLAPIINQNGSDFQKLIRRQKAAEELLVPAIRSAPKFLNSSIAQLIGNG